MSYLSTSVGLACALVRARQQSGLKSLFNSLISETRKLISILWPLAPSGASYFIMHYYRAAVAKHSFEVVSQIYIFHIYTRPKFTDPTFTQNPDLHKPKFTQLRFTQNKIYTALHWHTYIYTTQIYTKLNLSLIHI